MLDALMSPNAAHLINGQATTTRALAGIYNKPRRYAHRTRKQHGHAAGGESAAVLVGGKMQLKSVAAAAGIVGVATAGLASPGGGAPGNGTNPSPPKGSAKTGIGGAADGIDLSLLGLARP
ncbi:hypothetical protein ACQP1W_33445 [Spirillospora sp. CA-255316]